MSRGDAYYQFYKNAPFARTHCRSTLPNGNNTPTWNIAGSPHCWHKCANSRAAKPTHDPYWSPTNWHDFKVHSAFNALLCTMLVTRVHSALLVTRGAAGQATFMRQVARDCSPAAIDTCTFQTNALHAVAHAILFWLIKIAQSCKCSFYM